MRAVFRCCYRLEIQDPHDYISSKAGCVVVTWHNRLLFFPLVFPPAARKRTVAVISASRDGQYIADVVRCFGVESVRGSSSRKAVTVEREAIRAIREGKIVAYTPDGPRGPRYKLKKGPIHLASTHHAELIPVVVNASRYWQLKSWDAFQIPKPFCKITLVLGDALEIPPDLDADGLEFQRQRVENALLAITRDRKS